MLSRASTGAAKTSQSIFWTLFSAIQSVGKSVLAMSQALTSTMQKCQAGMEKIAKDMTNPAPVKTQNVAANKKEHA